ncbi:hypothetical protein MMC22_005321 [Lobaria immixta]|nr:hypothetical protein [Lobaria immixta]
MDRLRKEVETTQRAVDSIPAARKTPSHDCRLGLFREKLHQGLRKAESSLAIQRRTEVKNAADATKIQNTFVVFCPNHALIRDRLYEEAGTQQDLQMLLTRNGLRAVARRVMREGLLHQFSLAREQIDRAEGRIVEGEGVEEGEEAEEGEGVEEDEETEEATNYIKTWHPQAEGLSGDIDGFEASGK